MDLRETTIANNANMNSKQKYFGKKLLLIYLALVGTFAPISTDIYLPSLGKMGLYFSEPLSTVNLTLSMFFVFYSIGILLWGPLSDKYGRKKILLTGVVTYTVASISCVFSTTIWELIAGRIMQAIGGAASVAVVSAIIKDVYVAKERETALATVQSIAVLAPMVAPLLGAAILNFFPEWQVVFMVLASAGIIATVSTLFFSETHGGNSEFTILSALLDIKVAISKFKLATLLLIFSLPLIPFLSYIVSASYIYMSFFNLTAMQFSLFFAANAGITIVAPVIYIKVLRKYFQLKNMVAACFGTMIIAGICMYLWGSNNEWLFFLTIVPCTLAGSVLRPPGANIILSKHENAGTTSSLMGFSAMFLGGIGTLLVSLSWTNIIDFLGILFVIIGILALTLWLVFYDRIVE